MKKTLLLILITFTITVTAQKEAAVWYFGSYAGLDFNTTGAPPTKLYDGKLNTLEGCASIADATGQLLFYVGASDPNPPSGSPAVGKLTVWNKNHNVMPSGDNALIGDVSATQAAMIVPKPGDSNIYYVFSVPANSSSQHRIFFYEIDMSLDSGNGDIVGTGTQLGTAFFVEKITAVKGNGNFYWIICYGGTSDNSYNSFYAFKLDATGVNTTPVISASGLSAVNDGRGSLKVSASGTKIALANVGARNLNLYDFDVTTGVVSNRVNLPPLPNTASGYVYGKAPYGLEFSLTGNKLYCSYYNGGSSSQDINLVQYDLTNANARSLIFEVRDGTGFRGALQMAIDGKIYFARPKRYITSNTNDSGSLKLGAINNPEAVGAACNYNDNAVLFNANVVGPSGTLASPSDFVRVQEGLPPFIQSFFNVSIVYQQDNSVCEGNSVSFSINSNQALTATEWNFGDASPLVTGTETPSHTFPILGEDHTYTINLHTEYIGDLGMTESQDFTEDITIYAQPVLSAGATVATIEQCDDNNDGFYAFDLHTLKDSEILGLTNASALNSFQVRYFPTETDLDADTNEITANPYTNVTAYSETLWARVENANHPDCYVKIPFDINVFDTPTFSVGSVLTPLQACDDNNDGFFNFDLHTLKDAEVVALAPAGNVPFQVRYFPTEADLDADTNEITANPFTNTTAYNQTIWVRLENSTHIACYDKIALVIEVYDLPVLSAGATIASIEQCDTDNDGFFAFDLHALKDAEALTQVGIGATFQVRYFPTEADLDADTNEITANPYTNVTAYSETLWIRIENAAHNACYTKISFVINIYDTPNTGTPDNLADCDNNGDGDDTNGIIIWDLATANDTNLLNGQDPLVFEVLYYASNADFLADIPIAVPATYANTSNPQTITAVVRNRGNNTCLATTTFTLTVNPLPTLIAGVILKQCDEDANPADGLTNFNLNEANSELVADVTGLSFTYFGDPALTIPLVPQDNYINLSNPQTIYALITNDATACTRSIALNLETSASQIDPNLMVNLVTCDDDGIEDGFHLFDLQDASATILAGLPAGQPYSVSYYATLVDAQLEQNTLPLTNYMSILQSQDIYVRVDNDANNDCFGIGIHVNLLTDPLPQPILGDYFFCTNIGFVTVDATITDGNSYSYSWNTGEITAAINATAAGDYTVTVTNTATSCSNTAIAHVAASSAPDSIIVFAVDNSQNNSMEIFVTGSGNYEYSIDNGFTYYDSNYFEHLAPGIYTIVVRDKNGCGTITTIKALVGFPPYFTPNGDGTHDYWKPLGILNPQQVTIEIYDRYGKLIKTIRADGAGWDGLYNGFEMPSTDYWFHVKLPAPDSREFRSHFALKR